MSLAEAIEALNRGGVVVVPTETVYGIVARLDRQEGIDRIFEAKGRSRELRLQVMFASRADTFEYSIVGAFGRSVMASFTPGPLMVIGRAKRELPDLGGEPGTIGIRIPDHPAAQALLRSCGPLAGSSANRSGEPDPPTIDAVREQLGDRVDVYVDMPPAPAGISSTIVDFTATPFRVVREGAISREEIQRIAGTRILLQ